MSNRKRRAIKREAKSFLEHGESSGTDRAPVVESAGLGASPGALLLREEKLANYEVSDFDFRSHVREIIEAPEGLALHELHLSPEGQECLALGNEGGHRGNPFQQRWQQAKHSNIVHNTEKWQRFDELLRRFVVMVVAPLMGAQRGSRIIYQMEPTLRVQMPSERCLGKPHTDADYFHLASEINFWIPCSDGLAQGNTLWAESRPGAGDFHPFVIEYGTLCRFYGNKCRHYTVPNQTTRTRVSIDLRVISEESGGFIDNNRFRVGEYFHSIVVP